MKGRARFLAALKQKALLTGIILLVLFVMGLALFGIDAADALKKPSTVKTSIESADMQLPHVGLWAHKQDLKSKVQQTEIDGLKKALQLSEQTQAKLLKEVQLTVKKQQDHSRLNKLEADLLSVQSSVQKGLVSKTSNKETGCKILSSDASYTDAYVEKGDPHGVQKDSQPQSHQPQGLVPMGLRKITLNLASSTRKNTPKYIIPAASVARAVLLGGVDASTATNATSNPRPVILELVEDGSLPRRFTADVKNCRLIGAASGDISSERVYVRLETLTCIHRKTEQITETKVQGYVAGEDGRTGIRGTVVIKDRELLMQSLMGGVLGGASKALSQLSAPSASYNPFTGNVNRGQNTFGLMKQAGGEGVGSALDKYAKYNIERAELLQPVIQVAAGRSVDVVFTKGVNFNDAATQLIQQPNEGREPHVPINQMPGQANNAFDDGAHYAETFMDRKEK